MKKTLRARLSRVVLLRRRRVTLLAGLLAVAAIFLTVNDPAIVGAAATQRELPIYCVRRDHKVAALTFDAAWGSEDTAELIDILGRYGVRATFFVVGDWAQTYPDSVRALHEAGHEVMNHSDTHEHFSRLSSAEIRADLNACNDRIEALTGERPTLFRVPYGEYDDNVIATVRALGMQTIQWDVDSLDWKELSAGEISSRVLDRVQPGSIILFHNAGLHTPEALPGIIERLLRDGYSLVPVSEILLDGDYAIDREGRQIPLAS